MKLLLIYGPPAVGKLTVAEEVAKLTGFKVFHNHLSIDCVTPVFEFGTPSFAKLVELIRIETIAEAARVGRDLIFTFCYAKDLDDAYVASLIRAVEENGGEVCSVLLTAAESELEKRVTARSRRKHGKVKTTEFLRKFFVQYELFAPLNDRESLVLDNTSLQPEAAARAITEHFGLDV
jgi:hypothetical protein